MPPVQARPWQEGSWGWVFAPPEQAEVWAGGGCHHECACLGVCTLPARCRPSCAPATLVTPPQKPQEPQCFPTGALLSCAGGGGVGQEEGVTPHQSGWVRGPPSEGEEGAGT